MSIHILLIPITLSAIMWSIANKQLIKHFGTGNIRKITNQLDDPNDKTFKVFGGIKVFSLSIIVLLLIVYGAYLINHPSFFETYRVNSRVNRRKTTLVGGFSGLAFLVSVMTPYYIYKWFEQHYGSFKIDLSRLKEDEQSDLRILQSLYYCSILEVLVIGYINWVGPFLAQYF